MSLYKGREIYKGSGIYKSAGIYKGNGIYENGEGGGEIVLPPFTLRFTANRAVSLSDFRELPITLTLVDDVTHTYDVKLEQTDWSNLFYKSSKIDNTWLVEVIAANTANVTDMRYMLNNCKSLTSIALFDTSSVTDMRYMLNNCKSLTSIPLFNTSSVTDMRYILNGCRKVESGALALYTQVSTQANPPDNYSYAFNNCGIDTPTGLAELQQIPISWGGLAS